MDNRTARPQRRLVVALAAAFAVAIAAVAIGVASLGDDGVTSAFEPGTALGGGDAMTSCLPFSEEALALAPIAFDGTVADIDGSRVTLDVNRWYRGESGDTVELTAPELTATALVGAVPFAEGERYLVSGEMSNGEFVASVCGFSVTYSDEMADAFERAFG